MLKYIPNPLAGLIGGCLMALHTTMVGGTIFLLTPLKLILRPFRLDTKLIPLMRAPFHYWYKSMHIIFGPLIPTKVELILPEEDLNPSQSSLLVCNHQSWLDIPFLLSTLRNHISSPTYFLKKQLLYVPLIGSSAWAMDMIFVNRYTKKQIEKNPDLKGRDIRTAKVKCRKLRNYPTTVINFCEGTRFTEVKYEKSPKKLKNLLPPRAGGMNFTLNALGNKFSHILDVSIVYHTENQEHIMWEYLSGRVPKITIKVNRLELTPDLLGDYDSDPEYRAHFQNYLNELWKHKDLEISKLKS